jgi:hypothetical protein
MAPKNKLKITQEHSHHLYLLLCYHNVIIMSLYDLKPNNELISVTLEEVKIDLNANRSRV